MTVMILLFWSALRVMTGSAATSSATSRLRAWREAEGLSLGEVSGLTGISVPMLSRVERGLKQMAPLTRVQFARRLGLPVQELFDIDPLADDVD